MFKNLVREKFKIGMKKIKNGKIPFVSHETFESKRVFIQNQQLDFKMPFIKLFTNLAKDKLPLKLMPNLCQELAPILEKDPKVFNWILETDKCMSKVKLKKKIKKIRFSNFFTLGS